MRRKKGLRALVTTMCIMLLVGMMPVNVMAEPTDAAASNSATETGAASNEATEQGSPENADGGATNGLLSTDLSKYVNDSSTVQFTYLDTNGSNQTVYYDLKSGNIVKDGDTPIKDKNGNEFDLAKLKGIKAMIATSFPNGKITTDQVFTYDLPNASSIEGLTWTGSDWKDLTGSDKSEVFGSYRINDSKVEIKFNDDFINLDNRRATVTLDATFDGSKYKEDKELKFVFGGIGTFIGSLKAPKDTQIEKQDAIVSVNANSDIVDIFKNHARRGSSTTSGTNYPYIELTDDGQYIPQILKATFTGNQTEVEISDYYGDSWNYWKYDTTIGLVKVSKDGTKTPLTSTQYTESDNGDTVTWKLTEGVSDGDEVYVAYRTKYKGGLYRSNNGSTNANKKPQTDEKVESKESTVTYTREYDAARVKSKEVPQQKSAYINNDLYYYGVSKTCTNLDTVNKEATWVIYYNLGTAYTKLDGINIKDQASEGKLNIIDGSVNVSLLSSGNTVKYITSDDVRKDGTKLIDGDVVKKDGWEEFKSKFMAKDGKTTNGFTIPAGTGYGALRIEFKTSYKDSVETDKGDSNTIKNDAYWIGSSSHGVQMDVSETTKAYPKTFTKSGKFAPNENGKDDEKTGLIKWTSYIGLDKALKLEYRDGIRKGQRLALDNSDKYPLTITYNDGSAGAKENVITEYEEGVSDDADAIYYILTVNDDIDKKYITDNNSSKDNPSFVIKFVDKDGEEVVLPASNYYITYYTYYSPMAAYSSGSSRNNDVGQYYHSASRYNYAWVVYNNGKNFMTDSDSVTWSRTMYKGSDKSASSYTGDNKKVPAEFKTKAADELFWWFSIGPMTETTSKIVLRDEFNAVYERYNAKSERNKYEDSQKLKTDRFAVYSGDTKLDESQYTLEETDKGFNLTLEKKKGYDPTQKLTVYYMTKIPTEKMQQGEKHYYGNSVWLDTAYDEALSKLKGEESKFYEAYKGYFYNGDYQDFTYQLLSKGDNYDAATQYIRYNLNVNPYELTLNDGKPVEITDTMSNELEYDVDDDGKFIVPVQVHDKDGNALSAKDYKVDLKQKADGSYGPLVLTIPDGKHLTIEYRVRVKPGLSSLTDIEASNSVTFTTGKYNNVGDTDVVKLTNLGASAGGEPVYVTIQKGDKTNPETLLDDAEFQVIVYKRGKDAQGNYTLTRTETTNEKTLGGVFSKKTAYGRVIEVKETKAPTGYTIDDETSHYYILERAVDGTKDDWKANYANTFLKDVDWDNNVELFNTKHPKAVFEDSPITARTVANDEFVLTKKDSEDNKTSLPNAEYSLYSDDKATTPVKVDGKAVAVTTGEDGSVKLSTADGGVLNKILPKDNESVTYYVKESGAPAGYTLSDEVRSFTIKSTAKSDWNDDHTAFVTSVKYEITTDKKDDDKSDESMVVADGRDRKSVDEHSELKFTKTDSEDDAALANAEFTLYSDEALTKAVKVFKTSDKGIFSIATDDKDLKPVIPDFGDKDKASEKATLYLKETKAPAGYKLENTVYNVEVKVDRDTKWDGEGADRKYVTTTTYTIKSDDKDAVTVKNDRDRTSTVSHSKLTVTKADAEDKAALADAEFTLYADEALNKEVKTFKTGEDGTFTIATDDKDLESVIPSFEKSADTGAATATLYLKETKAPNGYKLNDNVYTVEVKATRNTKWQGTGSERKYVTTTDYVITANGKDTLTVEDSRIRDSEVKGAKLTVTKTDAEDNSALADAEFTLFSDEKLTKEVKTFTTGEDGTFAIDAEDADLKSVIPDFGKDDEGSETITLYLKETKAPEGYKASNSVYAVEVKADRDTKWTGEGADRKYLTTTVYGVTVNGKDTLTVANDRDRLARVIDDVLTLTKTDGEDDAVLENAEFTLFSDEKLTKEVKTFKTGEDGTFTITTDDKDLESVIPAFEKTADTGSATAKLYLKETKAPNGYKLSDTVYTVNVKVDRNTEWQGEGSERKYVTTTTYKLDADGDNALAVANERNRISEVTNDSLEIAKVDNKKNELSGAEFTLFSDEAAKNAIKSFKAGRATISTDDEALAPYLPVYAEDEDEGVKETTIYLKETKAPKGYKLDTTLRAINIKAERTTEWNEGHDAYITKTTYTITADDSHMLEITNIKEDVAGPMTGDANNIWLPLILLIVSGALAVFIRRRTLDK